MSGVLIQFPTRTKDRTEGTASLDRIDSTRGYSKDNIQWVHKMIQKIKIDVPQAAFVDWCQKVAGHTLGL